MKYYTGKYIVCKTCNKSFYIPKNRFNTAVYCSRKCKGIGENTSEKSICPICNNVFEHINSRVNKAMYCSRKCYHKAMSVKGTVIKICPYCNKEYLTSPSRNRIYCSVECRTNFKKNIYIPKSFTSIRKYFLNRNMINKCLDCGYNYNKSILGIHHIDHNRKNNSLDNLIVLCPNCHSLRHREHIVH